MKILVESPMSMLDPSLLLRPEKCYNDKPIDAFRDYSVDDSDPIKERVRRTYYDMHTNMTVDFVKGKMEKWLKFNHFKATIKEALIKLNELVDESDPDTDLPNIVHAFQTAERIRQDHPNDDWFHLIGLIHDLGKVMAFYDEPQWCVVGDTFAVGCKWGENVVYGPDSFKDNPDTYNPKYNTEYGMYSPKCGIENLMMSWGHDEYLYRFLLHNKAKFPLKGLHMIRYHSFYPWHAGGDYQHLLKDSDEEIRQNVLEFNKYDLYTKSAGIPDIEALWPYYESLIDKYIPGELEF
ncbi:inositol oxygenase-like isoform X1 [Plodia interpunctella]|uniref:inositol oxygenase-like isoform X1 n=1 Tax=Plodia interpunctella TaxID=58824 RepID=UPI002367A8CD|nr:inositol oxygenase-like isoform X1 [Plodia interpunctella]